MNWSTTRRTGRVCHVDLALPTLRIAKTGSVKVTEAFAVERYSHVMHTSATSKATAGWHERHGCAQTTLRAQAPKVHAMEIIDGWSPTKRGLARQRAITSATG
jgi:anthranilate synthase component 1